MHRIGRPDSPSRLCHRRVLIHGEYPDGATLRHLRELVRPYQIETRLHLCRVHPNLTARRRIACRRSQMRPAPLARPNRCGTPIECCRSRRRMRENSDRSSVPESISESSRCSNMLNRLRKGGRRARRASQNLIRTPPNAASGAAKVMKRGSEGFDTPGSGVFVTSPKIPKVAYWLLNRF